MVDRATKQQSAAKAKASTAPPSARPFQCKWHEGCSKSFNRKSDLQRHYRIHTNERPYACDYKPCEKTFIQRSALTVHRRTHTGDKPHKCPYLGCGKCFSDSSSLARHRRIHTNDKPYICKNQQCRKSFCRKTTMTKHFRKEHPTEPDDQSEDLESSENEQSEDEPSLEQDTEDSPQEDRDSQQERDVKAETPQSQGACNYNANLWRLPGHTAQPSGHRRLDGSFDVHSEMSTQVVKLERSMTRTPQRTSTDPYFSGQGPQEFVPARANTIPAPLSIPPRLMHGTNDILSQRYTGENENRVSLWQSPRTVEESPTSMTNSSPGLDEPQGPFPGEQYSIDVPPSVHSYPHRPMAMMQEPCLQEVTDIILDDPQPQPQRYTSTPQVPPRYIHHHSAPLQEYRAPTPTPVQNISYSTTVEPAYHAGQFAPEPYPGYILPHDGIYTTFPGDPLDPSKIPDFKFYSMDQMPAQMPWPQ